MRTEPIMKRSQEAVAAWKDYRETSLHATLDELDAWLATWGTHEVLPMPKSDVLDQSGTTLLALRGTGRGRFGANVGQAISQLRNEW
jgi:hypothetical protein